MLEKRSGALDEHLGGALRHRWIYDDLHWSGSHHAADWIGSWLAMFAEEHGRKKNDTYGCGRSKTAIIGEDV